MTLKRQLLSYYKRNTEDFNHDIEELDSWNGYLGSKRYYRMEEFSDYYQGTDPLEILRRAFFGYDEDDSTLEEKEPFNPNKDYFYLNGMRDLVSTDQQDYSDYLDDRFVEEIIENGSDNLVLSPGAQEIIEDYQNQEKMYKADKMEFKLTADEVGIDQNDELGILDLFYTLVEDGAFEKLGEELFKAQMLEFSDNRNPDEVEDWFFDNSKVIDWKGKAKDFYNPTIGHNDIKVELQETRAATVNGIKFIVSASASKDELYKNREAQKMIELKIWQKLKSWFKLAFLFVKNNYKKVLTIPKISCTINIES